MTLWISLQPTCRTRVPKAAAKRAPKPRAKRRALSCILPPTDHCYSMPAAITTHRFDEIVVNEGTFAELADLLESGSLAFSPANIWPEDRSWFIYTDYDLWATRVSGSADLIARIENDPDLETIRWSPSSENP